MESYLDERGKFGSSGMYIIDPEYKKKKQTKCSNRWCLLLIVLLIIAVVVGATVGIRKAIQSSESSGTSKQEQRLQYTPTAKFTSTPTSVTKGTYSSKMIASSSMESISPSRTSNPVPTSSTLAGTYSSKMIASSSMESISPSRTSYPVPTSTVPTGTYSSKMIASSSMENISSSRMSNPIPTSTVLTASSSMENISPSRTSNPVPTSTVLSLTVTSWSRWQAWSECSSSCGGGIQTRNRTCGNPKKPNVIIIANCYGNNVLYRNCSTWKCPDCSKPCPIGHLNSACDACICTNITVTGTVKNENGALLNNATIAFSEFPFNILARTNIAGHFELRGICVSQEEMIVQRNGYLPQLLNAKKIDSTSFTISARLEAIVFPEVTVQPDSKIRIENQAMTLCCTGVGKPETKYEWILNGRSVSEYQQDEKDSSKLIIPRVNKNMTGEVKCRVYNDYGAEFSNVAKITVIAKNDSCNDRPLKEAIALPPGCVDEETNSSTVDVGRCSDEMCIASGLNSLKNCFDNYCCQSLTENRIVIRCVGGISFNMTRTTSCGCGRCSPQTSTVNGIATGGPNNVPFKYGHICRAGKCLAQTGRNGDFSLTISGDLTRVVLNFKGKDRNNDFQDLTKVVPVVPGRETFVEVKMKPRPQPMLVNTSETIEIPMGLSNSTDGQSDSAPVVLSLPPQSLMTEDGETYNGTASVEVNFADPRNLTQIQEADGDFTAVSDDGDEQFLQTFGVLKLDFKDSNGKPLQTKTDIDVLLDLDEYNITEKEAENIKLWYMDEKTGRWRIMDSGLKQHESRRSKRSNRKFYFGKIDHTIYNKPVNLDVLSEICVVKIKVNENAVGTSSQSVKLTILSKQDGLNRYYEHSISIGTSWCRQIFCEVLTIQATSNKKVLEPNDQNIDVDLKRNHGIVYYKHKNASHRFNNRITINDISNPTGGPFFKDHGSCYRSSDNNSLIFDVPSQDEQGGNTIPSQEPKWHRNQELTVCYVKISAKDSCNKNVSFHVKTTNVTKNPPYEEGYTIVSTSTSNPSTCAEFKCPPRNTRDFLVTVTALTEGNINVTDAFKNEREDPKDKHQVFVGRVVGFRPIPGLNKNKIGVLFRRQSDDVSDDKKFHQDSKDYCEGMTAGIIFSCT